MRPFEIVPSYTAIGDNDLSPQDLFVPMVQKIIDHLIPEALHKEAAESAEGLESAYTKFHRMLPFFFHSKLNPKMNLVTVTLVCSSLYTHGIGRYLIENLSQWLIPGHPLPIVSSLALNFQFTHHKSAKFYLAQNGVSIHTFEEFLGIQKNLDNVLNEMRINILSVAHARHISSLSSISSNDKKMLIQQNLSSLLNYPLQDPNPTLYDKVQGVLRTVDTEEQMASVTKNISHLLQTRPKIFDRSVFYDMRNITHLFNHSFGLSRDSRHLARIIAYQYLFKKILQEKTEKPEKQAEERHLNVKVLRTSIGENRPVLAVLIGMNLMKESERFEIRNLLEAIRASLPNVSYVEDSLVADRHHEKIRFFYLEVEKPSREPFSQAEIKHLKQQLPSELIRQIENVIHPIFLPRNEEELMRNLIGLSKQLKFVRDLPQASIHYEKQTDTELFFTVLIVRLLPKTPVSIYQILKNTPPCLQIDIDDVRNMGLLRKKYPKEAIVLRISLAKAPFFRHDHSVDLLKARHKISSELSVLLGEFRDFNGGLILKQDEALQQLKQLLGPLSLYRALFLENYFYSLRPGTTPTIFEPQTLKEHFELLCESIELGKGIMRSTEYGLLSVFYPVSAAHKDQIFQAVNRLKLPPYSLTHASIQTEKGLAIGFILRTQSPELEQEFKEAVNECETCALHH